jgi:cell wall-associated NlpC family hydrolase
MTIVTLDRRVTPARPDVAADYLRGLVEAARFVAGKSMRVREVASPLRVAPRSDAPLGSEVLYGETCIVYETDEEGWSWGQLQTDGYVGYLSANALASQALLPTHRVDALRTFVYPAASIKQPALAALSLGSLVRGIAESGPFIEIESGFVWASHLVALATRAPDFVAVAERFVHTPYLWGGRTSLGLDCSGLVQLSLAAAGIASPRDSDMIERAFDRKLRFGSDPLRRGDLVFWKGHVGIMRDAATLLHANGHHMAVVSEPLTLACERILAAGAGPVTSVSRLFE